ncbi:hypothetical protein HI914_02815 [Erysiphe necator]|nr:hypothetical protein HI914_02815 [Erysiphe necator]
MVLDEGGHSCIIPRDINLPMGLDKYSCSSKICWEVEVSAEGTNSYVLWVNAKRDRSKEGLDSDTPNQHLIIAKWSLKKKITLSLYTTNWPGLVDQL